MLSGLKFGTDAYRAGSLERIEEARLLKERHYSLSIYVAGLAVEGMLRSLCAIESREFDERHDLRKIAIRVQNLGLLRRGQKDHGFVAAVEKVAKYWRNTLRFAGFAQRQSFLVEAGAIGKRDPGRVRKFCEEYFDDCSTVVRRCEILWQRSRKRN